MTQEIDSTLSKIDNTPFGEQITARPVHARAYICMQNEPRPLLYAACLACFKSGHNLWFDQPFHFFRAYRGRRLEHNSLWMQPTSFKMVTTQCFSRPQAFNHRSHKEWFSQWLPRLLEWGSQGVDQRKLQHTEIWWAFMEVFTQSHCEGGQVAFQEAGFKIPR